jgi:hypothetical protein
LHDVHPVWSTVSLCGEYRTTQVDGTSSLFVEALRGYIEALPDRQTGWLAGLRDPLVGRSIALLHGEPTRAWDLAPAEQRRRGEVRKRASRQLMPTRV